MKSESGMQTEPSSKYYVRLYGSDIAVSFPGFYGLEVVWVSVPAAFFRDALCLGNHTDPYEQRSFIVL